MNISGIRDGLKTRLLTIANLRAYDVIPDTFAPPAAIVSPPTNVLYGATLGKAWNQVTFTVRVLVAKASDRAAQDKLDTYLSTGTATSIVDAVEGDTTLDGNCNLARVLSAQGVGVYDYAGVPLLGAEFTVEVLA